MQAIEQQKRYEASERNAAALAQRMIDNKNEELDELVTEVKELKKAELVRLKEIDNYKISIADMEVAKLEFETTVSNR